MIYLANRLLLHELFGGLFSRETIPLAKDARAIKNAQQAEKIARMQADYRRELAQKRAEVAKQQKILTTRKNTALSAPGINPADKARIEADISRQWNRHNQSIKDVDAKWTRRQEMAKMNMGEKAAEYGRFIGRTVKRRYRIAKIGGKRMIRNIKKMVRR